MYEIFILEDTLAMREARSAIFLMKSDNVFKAKIEFRLAIIKGIKKQTHSEVSSLYPEVNSPPFKSEIKSKKVCSIINNAVGLKLNSSILSDFISKECYHKSKHNIAK